MNQPPDRSTNWPSAMPPERPSEMPPPSRAGLDVISQNEGDLPRRREARDAGAEVVGALFRLVKLSTMHATDNTAVVQRVEEIVEAIRNYAGRTGRNVSILFLDDTVLIGGQLLQGNRTSYDCARELGGLLGRVGVSEVGISRDARPADFFALATTLGEALRATRGTRVPERPTPRVRLRAASPLATRREGATDRLDPVANAASAYASACVVLRRLYEALGKGQFTLPHRIKRIAQRLVDLSAGEMPAFLGVTDAKRGAHDEAQRAVNATILTLAMARQITSDPVLLSRIGMAALLADIGRYHVAGAFPGSGRIVPQLGTDQERDVPAAAAMLLTALGRVNEPSVMRTVMAYEACAIGRRETVGLPYDGARSPTLQAYLIAAARAYVDAVAATLGSPSRTADEAVAHLTERWPDGLGRTALRLLIGALGFFPSGTLVELTTGEVAMVVATPADPSRYSSPRVRIVLDMAGHPIEPPFEVDLDNPESGAPPRRIRRVVSGGADAAAMSVRTPTSYPSATRTPTSLPASSTLRTAPTIAPAAPTGNEQTAPLQRRSTATPIPSRISQRRWADQPADGPLDAFPLPPLAPTRGSIPRISDVRVVPADPFVARSSAPISAPPTKPDRPSASIDFDLSWQGPDDDPDATPQSLASPLLDEDPDATPQSLASPPLLEQTLDSAEFDDASGASNREPIVPSSPSARLGAFAAPRIEDADDDGRTRAYSADDHNLVARTMPPPLELLGAIVEPARPTPTAEGNFARTPLVHLLVYILDQRLTGTATFFPPDGLSHDVYFEQGIAAKIRTGAMIWPLDRVLLNLRLVDEARLMEALVDISRTKVLLGRHLVARGFCSRENVLRALRVQLLQKLVSLCDLPVETTYAFYDGENLIKTYGGPELLRSEPLATIMAAVRASPESAVQIATLGRIARVPLGIVPAAELSRFELSREETAICDLLRARRMRLADVVAAGVAPEHIVKRIVYALVITRHLDLGAAQKPPVGLGPLPPVPEPEPSSRRANDPPRPTAVTPTLAPPRVEPLPPSSDSYAPPSQRVDTQRTPGTPPPPRLTAPSAPRIEIITPPPPPTPAPTPVSPTALKPPPPAPSSITSAPKPGAKAPIDVNARRAEINARASGIDNENYFEVLAVAQNASVEEARHSYFTLAKRWHPDRTPAELAEMKPLIARIFSRIGEAYATLGDHEKRGQYIKSLEGPGSSRSPAEEEQVERAVNAALEFQKAEALLKKNDIAGAERHIRLAADADPGQPEYVTLLAWVAALRRGEPKNLAQGATTTHYDDLIQMLDEVLRGDPRYERALFYRGTLLKRSGRFDKAIRDFRLAAELNPRNLDAIREVRLFDIRKREGRDQQGGEQQGGGIFGKWFKR